MNILFTCGGTAGHVYPAVALAKVFQQRDPDCRILFVGADGGMETRLIPKEGFALRTVTITNFHRSITPANIVHNARTVYNMHRSKSQARAILNEFRPDLVVGTGGYASYPVVRQASRMGIPTAIHESNAVPGLTTKTLSKLVDVVMVGFEASRSHYGAAKKVIVTGTPVRGEFFNYTREEARAMLGVEDETPVLLSFWGSLGARVMNEQTGRLMLLEKDRGMPFFHIHSAGRDYTAVSALLRARGIDPQQGKLQVREYIYDMPLIMTAADAVLCRAGASTISELTALGKPCILVPSPNVTANHQEKNARVLEEKGAALVLAERECTPQVLLDAAAALLANPPRRAAMAAAMQSFASGDAVETIYSVLTELMQKRN